MAVANDPTINAQELFVFVRINLDTANGLRKRFGIRGVPFLVTFGPYSNGFVGPVNPFTLDSDGESYRPWTPVELTRFIISGIVPP